MHLRPGAEVRAEIYFAKFTLKKAKMQTKNSSQAKTSGNVEHVYYYMHIAYIR